MDVPRHNHSSLYFECIDSIVTFGGSNTTSYLNTIFMMNIKDAKQNKVFNSSQSKPWPKVRHGHTANIYKQDQMIVFGGKKDFGTASTSYLNDLWSYNVKTNEWKEIKSLNDPPRERCWHSSLIYNDRFLLMSAGFFTLNSSEWYLNDLWSFDLETNLWTCLINDDEKSAQMKQRNRMGMVMTQDSLIIMFGNYFDGRRNHFWNDALQVKNLKSILYNTSNNTMGKVCWEKLELKTSDEASRKLIKDGRAHMSVVLLSESGKKSEILIYGGESRKNRHDTFFKLEINCNGL